MRSSASRTPPTNARPTSAATVTANQLPSHRRTANDALERTMAETPTYLIAERPSAAPMGRRSSIRSMEERGERGATACWSRSRRSASARPTSARTARAYAAREIATMASGIKLLLSGSKVLDSSAYEESPPPSLLCLFFEITLAGTPTASVSGGTSFVTTAPAPV